MQDGSPLIASQSQDEPQSSEEQGTEPDRNSAGQSDYLYKVWKDYDDAKPEYDLEPSNSKAINARRLQELQQAGIDADQPNAQIDRLAGLCASIFEVPGVTVTLYCGETLIVKSSVGLDERVPRHLSMSLAIGAWATYAARPRLLAVSDATLDARWVARPPDHQPPTPASPFFPPASTKQQIDSLAPQKPGQLCFQWCLCDIEPPDLKVCNLLGMSHALRSS